MAGFGCKSDTGKSAITEPETSDHYFNGMKIDTIDASEPRSLRGVRDHNIGVDEHRISAITKPNQQIIKSGNGSSSDKIEPNGLRYNALSAEEDYDDDEVRST